MLLRVTDKEWIDLKGHLLVDPHRRGAILVTGPSKNIAQDACLFLEHTSQSDRQMRYFLCSGSEMFHAPCYITDAALLLRPESPGASDVLKHYHLISQEHRKHSLSHTLSELEHMAEINGQGAPLIVIECLTPLVACDFTFIRRLLAFAARKKILLLIFFHQQEEMHEQVAVHSEAEQYLLFLLYCCGGRMREEEYKRVLAKYSNEDSSPSIHLLLTCRRTRDEVWLCYASRNVAMEVDTRFRQLDRVARQELTKKVLQYIPRCMIYPFLAVACQTNDIKLMVLSYSREVLEDQALALKKLTAYFRCLRRGAKAAENPALADVATLNYLALLLSAEERNALRIYRCLRHAHFASVAEEDMSGLWFSLGQQLARLKHPEAWQAASDCFQRSQQCLSQAQNPYLDQAKRLSRLAAIDNGEALVAFKYKESERARNFEEKAFARLNFATSSKEIMEQRVLIKTNVGDVFLRLFQDVDAALIEYETAYALASSCGSVRAMAYIVMKLAHVLERKKRYEKGIQVLMAFLVQLHEDKELANSPMTVVKVTLSLAQMYLAAERHRSAVACYWQLLRRPEHLSPALLQGIVSNLRLCRVPLSDCLHRRINRIICEQEMIAEEVQSLTIQLAAL